MAEKPRHLLWSVPPSKEKAVLDDLNRLSLKHGLLGTTSISCTVTHVFTKQDFDNTRTGALVRAAAKDGAAASVAPRKEKFRERDIEMALKFNDRKKRARTHGSNISDSDLKAQIGATYELSRSASIEAIDNGLRHLGQK